MKNILIYTGPSCNFCDAAKRLLERNKLKFSEIDVSSEEINDMGNGGLLWVMM